MAKFGYVNTSSLGGLKKGLAVFYGHYLTVDCSGDHFTGVGHSLIVPFILWRDLMIFFRILRQGGKAKKTGL
jgi:hypothetical protein